MTVSQRTFSDLPRGTSKATWDTNRPAPTLQGPVAAGAEPSYLNGSPGASSQSPKPEPVARAWTGRPSPSQSPEPTPEPDACRRCTDAGAVRPRVPSRQAARFCLASTRNPSVADISLPPSHVAAGLAPVRPLRQPSRQRESRRHPASSPSCSRRPPAAARACPVPEPRVKELGRSGAQAPSSSKARRASLGPGRE